MTDRNNPQIYESIGYLKTHEPNVEPSVEMRVHLNEGVLVKLKFSDRFSFLNMKYNFLYK